MKTNPAVFALMLLGGALLVYLAILSPLSSSLLRKRTQLNDEESKLATVEMQIANRANMRERISIYEKTNEIHRAVWLTPLLNSYAMRVKSLIDTMAAEAGLVNVEYGECPFRVLPIPQTQLPTRRTARRAVSIRAIGDYAAAASFVLRLEKEIPILTVQSFVMQQSKTPRAEQQDVEIILEWPGEGEVIR